MKKVATVWCAFNSQKCASGTYNISLDETEFQGTRIVVLRLGSPLNLTDGDRDAQNKNVSQFQSSSFVEPAFAVTGTGDLQLVDKLDFETKTNHQLTLIVNNIGERTFKMGQEVTTFIGP